MQNLGIFAIYAYRMDNRYFVSVEGGWHGEKEEDAFYTFLAKEKVVISSDPLE